MFGRKEKLTEEKRACPQEEYRYKSSYGYNEDVARCAIDERSSCLMSAECTGEGSWCFVYGYASVDPHTAKCVYVTKGAVTRIESCIIYPNEEEQT